MAKTLGLIGARITVAGALKLGCHVTLTVRALGTGRSRWWLAAGAASLATDVVLTKKLADPDYRIGPGHLAIEAIDSALWGVGAGAQPSSLDRVMAANALPSALVEGWRLASGTTALPVYDEHSGYPYPNLKAALPSLVKLAVPTLLPLAAATAARKAAGYRTTAAHVTQGLMGAAIGIMTARQRHRLQERTTQVWRERARSSVEHERAASRFALMTTSSPGHDFKKTLFALGLAGSDEAMAAALEQGARPGQTRKELSVRLLAEAAHRVTIIPFEEGMRPITDAQVTAIQEFISRAPESARDGSDQTLRVEASERFGLTLRYLDSELELINEPPPLAARLNPMAVTIGAGAMLKLTDLLLPYERTQGPLIVLPLIAIDLFNMARHWGRPPSDDNLDAVLRISLASGVLRIIASALPMTELSNPDLLPVYPAFHAMEDILLVLLPNWDFLYSWQRRLLPLLPLVAFGATAYRHRKLDWLTTLTDFTLVTNALSVYRVASRVEDEARMLEVVLFESYATQVQVARQQGQAEELGVYRRQLEIARSALNHLVDLDPEDRHTLALDCDLLGDWLEKLEPMVFEAQQ